MYFHPDVLTEVLLRLPVDSIVRFRCVSKEWNSLISSASFISAQTHFAKPPSILLLGNSDGCGSIPEAPEYKNFGIPMAAALEGLGVHLNGYCHGLVCLSIAFWEEPINDVLDETILVWNPTLRIYLEVPEFGLKVPHYYSGTAGFGIDVRRNDYKIVRIPNRNSDGPKRYEVFELSRNAWKIVTPNKFPPRLWDLSAVYFNGSAHWMSEGGTIVAFDFADEAFIEMSFPGELQKPSPHAVKILVRDGRYLSAVFYSHLPYEYNGSIFVWVMKEYGVEESWSILFHIHDPVMGIPQELFCFRTNGLLLVTTDYTHLVSYDCSTNTETSVVAAHRFKIVVELSETLALLQVPGTSEVKYKKQALDIEKKV